MFNVQSLYLLVPDGLCLSIKETADLLGFLCTNISRVYREWKREKYPVEQFCGSKGIVDTGGERTMARLFQADIKATVTHIPFFGEEHL